MQWLEEGCRKPVLGVGGLECVWRHGVGFENAPGVSVPRGAQELCESRGGRPGLPSLISLRFLWT